MEEKGDYLLTVKDNQGTLMKVYRRVCARNVATKGNGQTYSTGEEQGQA